jgi:peptide/nickel transport system substrate-binding protein
MMATGLERSTADRSSRCAGSFARLLALVMVAACAAPEHPAGTVVLASGADLESANPLVTVHPLSAQVQRYALFVTLARLDSALRPTPYYARRWTWSADRRSLTFDLDPALRWHDGAPTTARDVAYTLDAARDPATGYARSADLAIIDRVDAIDDSTLRIGFRSPPADLPLVLCELPVIPEHQLARVPHRDMRRASFNTAPVGNGPFRFVSRTPGQRWILERDSTFPPSLGGPPRLRRFIIAVVDEPTTKFAGLVSGELDVAGIAPTMAGLVRRDSSLRVIAYPSLFSTALLFNTHRPPFDDLRVRRALDLGVDRERIVRAALAGFGIPAAGPVSPASPFAIAESLPPAPRRAQLADSLLDAAGWRRGTDGLRHRAGAPLRFTVLTVGSGDNAIEQLLQADFAALGARMEIRQLELGAFLAGARAPVKTFDALVTGIPGDLSLSHIAAMFDGTLAGGALDYAAFHRPALDAAFARARDASDLASRRAAWADVQHILDSLVPAAWIYHSRGVQGLARRVHGVTMDLRGELPTLARWSVEDDR